MIKTDIIIAVRDVQLSSKWYQSFFDCSSSHGGEEFDVLVSKQGAVIICLHKWGEHEHPTMLDQSIVAGNGLILYFRTDNMESIHKSANEMGCILEKDIHINPNTQKKEFSLRDPDGYYLEYV